MVLLAGGCVVSAISASMSASLSMGRSLGGASASVPAGAGGDDMVGSRGWSCNVDGGCVTCQVEMMDVRRREDEGTNCGQTNGALWRSGVQANRDQ